MLPVIALLFLVAAIVIGFVRNINVGFTCLGLSLILGIIGGVGTSTILGGFPSKLFMTLLGTMFFFSLLQENHTLELLSKKMVNQDRRRTAPVHYRQPLGHCDRGKRNHRPDYRILSGWTDW